MKHRHVLVGLLCWFASLGAVAAEYAGVKQAMLEAIDAADGTARGVVFGSFAERFSAMTGSKAAVVVEVTTVKSFKQEGCKRLNVRLSQANVPTKDGKLTDFSVNYGINLCRDGSPPVEGMDLEKVGKVLEVSR